MRQRGFGSSVTSSSPEQVAMMSGRAFVFPLQFPFTSSKATAVLTCKLFDRASVVAVLTVTSVRP
jgi:hypothetical protein